METQTATPQGDCDCSVHPSVFYLFATLLLTSCSTAMLCAAIMTDHWEQVRWERSALAALANASNTALQWLLDDKVVKVFIILCPNSNKKKWVIRQLVPHAYGPLSTNWRKQLKKIGMWDELTNHPKKWIEETGRGKGGGTFLVPMNGGIWTMCVSLEEEEITMLSRVGFPKEPLCTNYLANSDEDEPRADWQHRMQNLSISCALVCLIVLGSAALVGAFGICKHQISAVLITGVMYLLAGLFAMFTLMIIHFKRIQRVSTRGSHGDDTGDGVVGPQYPALPLLTAREFSTAWSLDLGWGGVALATTTSLLWILLSKIMRYNPISTMLL